MLDESKVTAEGVSVIPFVITTNVDPADAIIPDGVLLKVTGNVNVGTTFVVP